MTLTKVNKVAVRKAIKESGKWIGKIVPCKMHPSNPWGTSMHIEVDSMTQFEDICDTFAMYNCNSQVGYYIHFYTESPTEAKEDLTPVSFMKFLLSHKFHHKSKIPGAAWGLKMNFTQDPQENSFYAATYFNPEHGNGEDLIDYLEQTYGMSTREADDFLCSLRMRDMYERVVPKNILNMECLHREMSPEEIQTQELAFIQIQENLKEWE